MAKHRAHSFINLTGLSVGLACSLLILLWVKDELNVDAFHQKSERLYKLYEREYYSTHVDGDYDMAGVLADELKKKLPDIEEAITMEEDNHHAVLRTGDKLLEAEGSGAGAGFFHMFSYPLLRGDVHTALSSPLGIAVSRRIAIHFFGSPQAAMGKTIRVDNKRDYFVSAVFEDMPDAASRKMDYLISWDSYLEDHPWAKDWRNSGPIVFILLRDNTAPAAVDKKLTHFLDAYVSQNASFHVELGMQKFEEVYLHRRFKDGKIAGGRIEYVRLFSIVAVFILLIACINFMNLSTARSAKRSKEVGIRKVVGAMRGSLIRQFIGESMLLTCMAVGIALLLMVLFLPVFNQMTEKQLRLPFSDAGFWIKLAFITVITGLIAGSYPALFLSSFQPIKVLKSFVPQGHGAIWFRKGLVVFQFVISIVLITGTIVVSRQVNFIQHRNLGYDRENLLYIPMKGNIAQKAALFKEEALRLPGIQSISFISDNPSFLDAQTNGVDWEGRAPDVLISFEHPSVGYDITRTMKLQLVDGRDFSKGMATDSAVCLINETTARQIGYTNAVGRQLTVFGRKLTIIGVLKDFHFRSLHEPIRPLIMERGISDHGVVLVRLQAGQTKLALTKLEKLWSEINPQFPFTWSFSDEEYQKLYKNEQMISRLSNTFSVLAIFISCLGLLGLVMFTAEQRRKEIGIRKVLGASVSGIAQLISADFLKLVFIAILVACPIAWWIMTRWLDDYAYKITLSWWVFALASLLAVLITICTISFQAIRAALVNPAVSLKTE